MSIDRSTTGRLANATRVVTSTNTVVADATPRRLSFNFPPTVFRKGELYSLQMHGGSACRTLRRTTWAHAPVDPGPARCDEATIGIISDRRMWHAQGASDAVACDNSVPTNLDPTMPGGWLLVRSVIGPSVYTTTGSGSSCAGYDATLIERVFWKTAATGAPVYVCRFRQYSGGPGTETPQGWFSTLPFTPQSGAGAPRAPYLELHPIDHDALLGKHSPLLRYEAQERFFADSPAVFAENWRPNPFDDWNEFYAAKLTSGGGGSWMAVAGASQSGNPNYLWPELTLGLLSGPNYPSGEPVSTGDRIEPPPGDSGEITEDASRMRSRPLLADRVYGRPVYGQDGKLWLQYWLFYYYNSQNVLGQGEHYGDWEYIQIGMKQTSSGSLVPEDAVYARHADEHQRCPWTSVQSDAAGVPTVYVANGSHASYFAAGVDGRGIALPADEHRGDGRSVRPALDILREDSPSWVLWPGRWGDIDAPRLQSQKWSQPDEFAAAARSCTPGTASAPSHSATSIPVEGSAPLAPDATATLTDDGIAVSYSFGSDAPQVHTLLITAHSSNSATAPSGGEFRAQMDGATEILPLPRGGEPSVVRISAFTKRGVRSRVTLVRVR